MEPGEFDADFSLFTCIPSLVTLAGAYGGVYWEGKHKYNLKTWLDSNPQHAAKMEKDIGFQLADLAYRSVEQQRWMSVPELKL